MILTDYHIHTPLCQHATGEPRAYFASAADRGLQQICFTDHAPAHDGFDPTNRMVMEQFPGYLDNVGQLQNSEQLSVLLGIEADFYPGAITFQPDWIESHPFDLVIGSVHYIDDWGFDNPATKDSWKSVDVTGAWRKYFKLVAELADSALYDIVGHLDLPKKFDYRPADTDIREMATPALDRIAAAGMSIELNTAGLRKPCNEIYPSPLLLELAFEREIPIVFASDAHSPEEVAYAFDKALDLALAAGYTNYLTYSERKTQVRPLPNRSS